MEPCKTCPHLNDSPELTASFFKHPCHSRPNILCVGHLEGSEKCTKEVVKCRTLHVPRAVKMCQND